MQYMTLENKYRGNNANEQKELNPLTRLRVSISILLYLICLPIFKPLKKASFYKEHTKMPIV